MVHTSQQRKIDADPVTIMKRPDLFSPDQYKEAAYLLLREVLHHHTDLHIESKGGNPKFQQWVSIGKDGNISAMGKSIYTDIKGNVTGTNTYSFTLNKAGEVIKSDATKTDAHGKSHGSSMTLKQIVSAIKGIDCLFDGEKLRDSDRYVLKK